MFSEDDLDIEEFKRKQAEHQASKDNADSLRGVISGIGGALQAEANVPSAYEYLTGKKIAPTDFQGTADRAAKLVRDPADPADRQRKAMEYMKMKREGRLASEQDGMMAAKKDPNSTQSKAAKQIAGRFGIQVTPEMSAFDIEQMIDPKKMMETEAQSRVNFENNVELEKLRQKGDMQRLGATLANDRARAERELALKNKENELEMKNIPVEDREVVKSLAASNANKIDIANAIDANVESWKTMDDDQKLQSMRQLIKTLNSTQGKDAVGAEESKRLAGKLEFAMGNFTNDNPIQFGRDLEGFAQDAVATSKNIKESLRRNNSEIARRKGLPSNTQQAATPPLPKSPKDQKAMEWAMNNPADPRAKEIMQRLGVDANTAVGQR